MAMAVSVAALIATTGCGDDEARRDRTASAPSADAARQTDPVSPRGLADGEFVISLVGGRVQLASREAPRLEILRRLADLEGSTLDTSGLPEAAVTLQLDDASLGAALAALLDDVSYHSAFEYDADLGRNRLTLLEVGRAPSRGRPRAPDANERLEAARIRLEGLAAGAEEPDADERRWIEALDSANDRERREAVEEVDVDGPALARVIELATADPDPLVRVGALERLEESGTFAAVQGMLKALEDPEPRVVLRALEALDYAGDETVVPYLESLYTHPDPEVREAARETRDFLGF